MKKLLTVLLAIIAIGITSQVVAVQAAETSQNKAENLALEAEGQIGIPRDWTTVIQVVDHGTPGSKQQWGTSIQVDHKKHRITITRINIAAEKISGKISKTTEKDPLAELIWKIIVDRQPSTPSGQKLEFTFLPNIVIFYEKKYLEDAGLWYVMR